MKIAVSSAKRTLESCGRSVGRSFMKAEKRVGPRMEPCGTPEEGKPGEEFAPETDVTCERSER
jgi:hypothetical protein